MHKLTALKAFFGILFLSLSANAADVVIPLNIDNPTSYSGEWSLTCGIPFPLGLINNTENLVLKDKAGKIVPCQFDITATWLKDKSVRWVLASFKGSVNNSYRVEISKNKASQVKGITLSETDSLLADTGIKKYTIDKTAPLFTGTEVYVVTNNGEKAVLGGAESEMETKILAKGPMLTVIRKEGWYLTEKQERVARGIVWMYFYGNTANVRVVHRLVHTEDTRKVWFKDVGITFMEENNGAAEAVFALDRKGETKSISLKGNEEAWMMQDDFPHFMERGSHYSLSKTVNGKDTEISSGTTCGDWAALTYGDKSTTVVIRNLAEQFPKELTVTPKSITAHLWAGRSGRELDFRAKTLVNEYYGEWVNYASLKKEELERISSNAQSSAKTHVLWYMPGKRIKKPEANEAYAAARRILMYPDTKWLCDANVISMALSPKDEEKYPKAESYVSDFFDRVVLPLKVFPMTGYISFGSNPVPRVTKDKKTGKYFAAWWRYSGLVDYHFRKNSWKLYARSGERKYFDYSERFSRFAGDMNMHHWDTYDAEFDMKKVKGGFAKCQAPAKSFLSKKGAAGNPGSLPFYWTWSSGMPGGSGADISNYIIHFYFTGDWDVWEYAENFGEAVKKYDFMQYNTIAWGGGFTNLRYMVGLYSMTWDKKLGEMTRNLASQNLDVNAPNGISVKMRPNPLYKTARVSTAVLEYCRLMNDDKVRDIFIKIADYQYRFQLDKKAMAYQSGSSMYYPTAYILSGDKKFFQATGHVLKKELEHFNITLAEELKEGIDSVDNIPSKATHYSYFPFIGVPALIKMHNKSEKEKVPLPLPITANYGDFTNNIWAVFEKQKDQPVELEILFKVAQNENLEIELFGPDLKISENYKVISKQKRFVYPYLKGIRYYSVKIEIPKEQPAGQYRISQKNRGGYTVTDGNIEKCVLECPEGFWIGTQGVALPAKHYFKVPEGLQHVRLFVSRPVKIFRSDSSEAFDEMEKVVGEITLPVNGQSGFWYIQYDEYAFVKFLNLPPVISYLTPERYLEIKRFKPSDRIKYEIPDKDAVFTEGRFGKGLQLAGKSSLAFPRGEKTGKDEYSNFPGYKGTIEFWLRPNWSVFEKTLNTHIRYTVPVFKAGDIYINYELLMAGNRRHKSDIEIWGGHRTYVFKGRKARFGNYARYFPRKGDWVHVAATWDIDFTKKYDVWASHFYVYINGVKHEWLGGVPAQLRADGLVKDFTIGTIAEQLKLLPANAVFDEFRISDIARYTENFTPAEEPFKFDKNTKVLIHFDDNVDIETAKGKIAGDLNVVKAAPKKREVVVPAVNKNRLWVPEKDKNGNYVIFPMQDEKIHLAATTPGFLKDISYEEKTPEKHGSVSFALSKPVSARITQIIKVEEQADWTAELYKALSFYIKSKGKGSIIWVFKDTYGTLIEHKVKLEESDWKKITIPAEELKNKNNDVLKLNNINFYAVIIKAEGD
ncbi:MAG: RIFT barrel domain-containing protein, partial [Planctomycetota bacterium]